MKECPAEERRAEDATRLAIFTCAEERHAPHQRPASNQIPPENRRVEPQMLDEMWPGFSLRV